MDIFDLGKMTYDGDMIVTTDLSIPSATIKLHTWGSRYMFSQFHGSHIAVRATDSTGRPVYAEMLGTRKVTRYINRTTGQVLLEEWFTKLDPSQWYMYEKVRLRTGFVFSPADKYAVRGMGKHVVAVLRHPGLVDPDNRERANKWLNDVYVAARIVYDGNEIIEFNKINHILKWNGRADEWVCSETPRDMFKFLGQPCPSAWDEKVSPMDHQKWEGYLKIYELRK